MQRIRGVFVIKSRQNGHLAIAEIEMLARHVGINNLARRRQHPHGGAFVDGGIGPPIHRGIVVVGVGHTGVGNQPRRAGRQVEINLPKQVFTALVLVQSQARLAIGAGDGGGVDGGTRAKGMPVLADVPLNPPRKPGVAVGQIGRLKDRIAVQQFALRRLVEQRPQAPPQARHKGRFEDIVFEYHRVIADVGALAGVIVLHAVGQHAIATFRAQQSFFDFGHGGIHAHMAVRIALTEARQGVFGT